MSRKITLEKPDKKKGLDYILKYLEYDHNKTHILYAYHLLESLKLPLDSTVGDFGCRGGETLLLLKRMGFKDIIALDYDESSLENAREICEGGIKTFQADFNEPLPLASATCDVVTSFEVIEHVIKAEFFLGELFRVTKNGGYMIITTPNHAFYMSRWRALTGERLGLEGTHYRFFTKEQFEEIISKAGFKIVNRKSIGHLPLVNMEPWRSILKKKRVHHPIPESLESIFAINFVWLCRK